MKSEHAALLLIDIQKDFCPGGALPIKDGDQVCQAVNRVLNRFDFVVATQDWHPVEHCSFVAQGGPLLPHCIQKTRGAELHPDIDPHAIDFLLKKGDRPEKDAYSGFEAHDDNGRPLGELLKERQIERLYIAGLATDIGVRATVLDALQAGFQVVVLTDGVKPVVPADGDKALKEMKIRGAKLATSKELVG